MIYGKEAPLIEYQGEFLQLPQTTIGGRKPNFTEETLERPNVFGDIRLGIRKIRFESTYQFEICEDNSQVLEQLIEIYNKTRIVRFFPAGIFFSFQAVIKIENWQPWQGLINLGQEFTLNVKSQSYIKGIPSIDNKIVGYASPFSFHRGGIKEEHNLIQGVE